MLKDYAMQIILELRANPQPARLQLISHARSNLHTEFFRVGKTTKNGLQNVHADLLFGRHLSHVDFYADDLARLHTHGAGGLVCAGGGIEGGCGGVLHALSPGSRLPVIHDTRMLITVPHLLQGTGVRTAGTSCRSVKTCIRSDTYLHYTSCHTTTARGSPHWKCSRCTSTQEKKIIKKQKFTIIR